MTQRPAPNRARFLPTLLPAIGDPSIATRPGLFDLERSLEIHVRLDDITVPHLLMETAMAQAVLGEYRRAQHAYERALQIWKQIGNLFSQATLLNNLGFMYYQTGEYEKAAHAFEEGLLCARQCGHVRMEAVISISMGDLYSEIEDFEIADRVFAVISEAGFTTVGDLMLQMELDPDAILRLSGMGPKGMKELEDALESVRERARQQEQAEIEAAAEAEGALVTEPEAVEAVAFEAIVEPAEETAVLEVVETVEAQPEAEVYKSA